MLVRAAPKPEMPLASASRTGLLPFPFCDVIGTGPRPAAR